MKKTLSTITLAIVMTFGATFANAGIIIGDKSAPSTCTQTEKDGIIIGDIVGTVYGWMTAIVVSEKTGIIIGDRPAPCTTGEQSKDGIIIGD